MVDIPQVYPPNHPGPKSRRQDRDLSLALRSIKQKKLLPSMTSLPKIAVLTPRFKILRISFAQRWNEH